MGYRPLLTSAGQGRWRGDGHPDLQWTRPFAEPLANDFNRYEAGGEPLEAWAGHSHPFPERRQPLYFAHVLRAVVSPLWSYMNSVHLP